MPDKVIQCKDCQTEFTLTQRDLDFYASKIDEKTGRPWNLPSRCKPCRDARKQEKRGY